LPLHFRAGDFGTLSVSSEFPDIPRCVFGAIYTAGNFRPPIWRIFPGSEFLEIPAFDFPIRGIFLEIRPFSAFFSAVFCANFSAQLRAPQPAAAARRRGSPRRPPRRPRLPPPGGRPPGPFFAAGPGSFSPGVFWHFARLGISVADFAHFPR
jgi:hypothetical protein